MQFAVSLDRCDIYTRYEAVEDEEENTDTPEDYISGIWAVFLRVPKSLAQVVANDICEVIEEAGYEPQISTYSEKIRQPLLFLWT